MVELGHAPSVIRRLETVLSQKLKQTNKTYMTYMTYKAHKRYYTSHPDFRLPPRFAVMNASITA